LRFVRRHGNWMAAITLALLILGIVVRNMGHQQTGRLFGASLQAVGLIVWSAYMVARGEGARRPAVSVAIGVDCLVLAALIVVFYRSFPVALLGPVGVLLLLLAVGWKDIWQPVHDQMHVPISGRSEEE
ncbi:MAG TPA: hypothetical protein VG015_04145, partial [Candidatus Dormibacteraeota bacterium]|nr:hypothetical protein [Candidatus Dormibacteraeota bacterium]